MARGTRASTKIKRMPKTHAQRMTDAVATKAGAIGVPAIQVARGMHAVVDVPLRDGSRVVTNQTLINRGGTPVARWKAAKLLSDSQVAAIDHCEALWSRLDVSSSPPSSTSMRSGMTLPSFTYRRTMKLSPSRNIVRVASACWP